MSEDCSKIHSTAGAKAPGCADHRHDEDASLARKLRGGCGLAIGWNERKVEGGGRMVEAFEFLFFPTCRTIQNLCGLEVSRRPALRREPD